MTDRRFVDDNGDEWTWHEVVQAHRLGGMAPRRLMHKQRVRFIADENACTFCQMHGLDPVKIHVTKERA